MTCIWWIYLVTVMPKVPVAVRAHWEKLLGQYLQTRRALIGFGADHGFSASTQGTRLEHAELVFFHRQTGASGVDQVRQADAAGKYQGFAAGKNAVADLPHCSVQLFFKPEKQG